MNIMIEPSAARGSVTAPPSKSAAHRLLICAGLARGESRVDNLAWSDDVLATLDCLHALGVGLERRGRSMTVRGGLAESDEPVTLPCRESGSTLRFFLPLCLLRDRPATLTGSAGLFSRPMEVYDQLCLNHGIEYHKTETSLTVRGRLQPGVFEIPGDVSSQFATGLLLALPQLPSPSELRILPPVQSRSYIELTAGILRQFGVRFIRVGETGFHIPGRQRLRPHLCTVEGDWSNAAFLDALNLTGGAVKLLGLSELSAQGDKVYRGFFKALMQGKAELDLSDCPDLGPIVFAMAAHLHGGVFTGTGRLRYKESDRIACMAVELEKFGAQVVAEDDHVWIGGGPLHAPTGPLDCHNDHRIAMALAILCTAYGGTLQGAEAVQKSYPEFFDVLGRLGVQLRAEQPEEEEAP